MALEKQREDAEKLAAEVRQMVENYVERRGLAGTAATVFMMLPGMLVAKTLIGAVQTLLLTQEFRNELNEMVGVHELLTGEAVARQIDFIITPEKNYFLRRHLEAFVLHRLPGVSDYLDLRAQDLDSPTYKQVMALKQALNLEGEVDIKDLKANVMGILHQGVSEALGAEAAAKIEAPALHSYAQLLAGMIAEGKDEAGKYRPEILLNHILGEYLLVQLGVLEQEQTQLNMSEQRLATETAEYRPDADPEEEARHQQRISRLSR